MKYSQKVGNQATKNQLKPIVALLSCGYLFEDFFDTIGISLETFRTETTGSWMFNYIDALRLADVQTVLFFISARVSETLCFTHIPTGTTVYILPASIPYRIFSASMRWIPVGGKGIIHKAIRRVKGYLITPLSILSRKLKSESCTAILCQDYVDPYFDVCVFLGQWMQLPVFATFQGGFSAGSLIEKYTHSLALHKCAGFLIGSQSEIQRVHSRYGIPSLKLAQIFNPMHVTGVHPTDRQQSRLALGIPQDARVVVCHCRIDIWQKGLDILLDAWEQICSERPGRELCLLLIGTGNDAEKLHQQIDARKLPGVLWKDEFVNDRTILWKYLSAADVYTLPSRHEGFPVAPIEAMTLSLPVVAADAPGVSDIFIAGEASGGLVVPRNDPKALASALGRIIDNEALGLELGKCGRCRVEDSFSLEVIGRQMRDFLLSSKTQN